MLIKDRDWAFLDGLMCEVTKFTPLAKISSGQIAAVNRSMPYAFIDINCRENGINLAPDTCGAISHKLDFKHLWAAFNDRGVAQNEKVFVVWSKRNLRPATRIFSSFMPRLAVLIFKDDGYELLSNNNYRPELNGWERMEASLPIAKWEPDVWG